MQNFVEKFPTVLEKLPQNLGRDFWTHTVLFSRIEHETPVPAYGFIMLSEYLPHTQRGWYCFQ